MRNEGTYEASRDVGRACRSLGTVLLPRPRTDAEDMESAASGPSMTAPAGGSSTLVEALGSSGSVPGPLISSEDRSAATATAGDTCTRPDRGRGTACFTLGAGTPAERDCSSSWSASENEPDAFIPPVTCRRTGATSSEPAGASMHASAPPPAPDAGSSPSADTFRSHVFKPSFASVGVMEGSSWLLRFGNESSPMSGKSASSSPSSSTVAGRTAGLMLCATLSSRSRASNAFLLVRAWRNVSTRSDGLPESFRANELLLVSQLIGSCPCRPGALAGAEEPASAQPCKGSHDAALPVCRSHYEQDAASHAGCQGPAPRWNIHQTTSNSNQSEKTYDIVAVTIICLRHTAGRAMLRANAAGAVTNHS